VRDGGINATVVNLSLEVSGPGSILVAQLRTVEVVCFKTHSYETLLKVELFYHS
jgi:hypothetical protein